MSVGHLGQNLIFLISQPRAGSTLLQRILGNLPDIHTISEPWLLLPPIYSNRSKGVWYEFDAHTAHIAHKSLVDTLPHGNDDFAEAMRYMCVFLYNQILSSSGKSNFLDKTPRYYLIIPELIRLFPKAHFIILFRNPLGVLSSIQRTWVRERWLLFHKRKKDLLEAPALLLDGVNKLGDRCSVVQFEQLIKEPVTEVKKICTDLGIEFSQEAIDYGSFNDPAWRHGDKAGINQHAKPTPTSAEKWVRDIQNPQVWRLANDYMHMLGKPIFDQMGYSYHDICQTLNDHKPNAISLSFTYPSWLLLNALNIVESANLFERRVDRIIELMGDEGFATTTKAVIQGLKKAK